MISCSNRTCHSILFFKFIILLILFTHGCSPSSVKNIKDDNVHNSTGALIKNVWMPDFENKTFLKDEKIEQKFREHILTRIHENTADILISSTFNTDAFKPSAVFPLLESGDINNFSLAAAGKERGLDAIVLGSLTHITGIKKKQGLGWFRGPHYYLETQVVVKIYDTESSSKLLEKIFTHKIEIDNQMFAKVKANESVILPLVDNSLIQISDPLGEDISNTVSIQPWKSFITAVNGDRVTIASGKKAAIKSGYIFEVYDTGKILRGTDGHRFVLPGRKTGEIKVTSVFPETSEAIIISGKVEGTGGSVKLKQKS